MGLGQFKECACVVCVYIYVHMYNTLSICVYVCIDKTYLHIVLGVYGVGRLTTSGWFERERMV